MIKRITNIRVTTSCTGTIAAPEMPDHLISAMLEIARYERDRELEDLCLEALAPTTPKAGKELVRTALMQRYGAMRRCDRHRDEPGIYAETHPCVLPAVHSVTIDHMDSTGRMWPELPAPPTLAGDAAYNPDTARRLIEQARATPDASIDVHQRLGRALAIASMLADQLEAAMVLVADPPGHRKPRTRRR